MDIAKHIPPVHFEQFFQDLSVDSINRGVPHKRVRVDTGSARAEVASRSE
jgi:hypothetical protein